MTLRTDCATTFEPTLEHRARHVAWVDEMVATVWKMWQDAGEVTANPDEAHRLIRVVRGEYLVAAREQWMHPLDSIATKVAHVDNGKPPVGAARLDYFDALRTSVGLGDSERARWAAKALGVSAEAVKKYGPRRPRKPLREGRTALYRHFDDGGVLLYVGITNNPEARVALHAYHAEWLAYSARCDVEWHEDRPAALAAERAAIRDERPLFNRAGSLVDPADAEDYLLFRGLTAPPG